MHDGVDSAATWEQTSKNRLWLQGCGWTDVHRGATSSCKRSWCVCVTADALLIMLVFSMASGHHHTRGLLHIRQLQQQQQKPPLPAGLTQQTRRSLPDPTQDNHLHAQGATKFQTRWLAGVLLPVAGLQLVMAQAGTHREVHQGGARPCPLSPQVAPP